MRRKSSCSRLAVRRATISAFIERLLASAAALIRSRIPSGRRSMNLSVRVRFSGFCVMASIGRKISVDAMASIGHYKSIGHREDEMQNRQLEDKFMMRMPDGWRDAIKVEAAKNRRSMNAEILAAIEVAMRIKGVQLEPAS